MIEPTETDLAATVARMEAKLAADGRGAALEAAYAQVAARFEEDLSDPRDVLLSKGGALMVLQVLSATQDDC